MLVHCPVFSPWLQPQAEAALEASRPLLSILPSSEVTTNITELKSCDSYQTELIASTQMPQCISLGDSEIIPIPITLVTQPTSPSFSLAQVDSLVSEALTQSTSTISYAQVPPVAVTLPTSLPSTQALTRSPHPVNPFSVGVVAHANPPTFPVCQALPIETNVTQPLTPTSYQVADVHWTAPTSFLTSKAHPIVTTQVTQQPYQCILYPHLTYTIQVHMILLVFHSLKWTV